MDAEHTQGNFERRVARGVELVTNHPERLLAVVGPTASGKTDLAIAVAERVSGEIISADSVQIYRYFDLGSGKPTPLERARAHHHLIDTLDPLVTIDAAAYADLADAAIADVRSRGKVPILCGGTYFWVRALVFGLAPAPPADETVRARHRAIVEAQGREALHRELERVDPASAARLHPNDTVRVGRALEVYELSGKTMTAFQTEHGFRHKRTDAVLIAPRVEATELTERIGRRVDGWLAAGWIDEVDQLRKRGYRDARAMHSVGYKEVLAHLEGNLPRESLRDAIVQSTRIFTRRQRTWLGHADVEWV